MLRVIHAVKSMFIMALNNMKTIIISLTFLEYELAGLISYVFVMVIIIAGEVTGNRLTGLGSDMDLIKDFDTVPHRRLIERSEHMA